MIDKNLLNLILLAVVFSLHGNFTAHALINDSLYSLTHFFIVAIAFFSFVYVYNDLRKQIEIAKLRG